MAKIVVLSLTKHFGVNTAGETAGFTAETAEHIIESKGGVRLGEYDPAIEKCAIVTAADGKVEAKITKIPLAK